MPSLLSTICWREYSSVLSCLRIFVKIQLTLNAPLISGLSSLPCCSISLSEYLRSLIFSVFQNHKVRILHLCYLFKFWDFCFVLWHLNFLITSSISLKQSACYLTRIVMHVYINLWSIIPSLLRVFVLNGFPQMTFLHLFWWLCVFLKKLIPIIWLITLIEFHMLHQTFILK
jgi:hypothetical protein